MRWGSTWTCAAISRIQRRGGVYGRSSTPHGSGAPARAACCATSALTLLQGLLDLPELARSPSAGGRGSASSCARMRAGTQQGCDEAAQPSTHRSPRSGVPASGWSRCAGVPCALAGTPACGSAHRRAPVAGRSHGADCPARASTSGAAYPQPASPTERRREVRSVKQGHR